MIHYRVIELKLGYPSYIKIYLMKCYHGLRMEIFRVMLKGETEIKIPVLGSRVRVTFENDDFILELSMTGYKSQQDIDQELYARW